MGSAFLYAIASLGVEPARFHASRLSRRIEPRRAAQVPRERAERLRPDLRATEQTPNVCPLQVIQPRAVQPTGDEQQPAHHTRAPVRPESLEQLGHQRYTAAPACNVRHAFAEAPLTPDLA